jgi:hypothetical protein
MYDNCLVCEQRTEIEPGFYYGTSYVSYALTVAFSASTFVAWWVIIGLSTEDNRIFWWLSINGGFNDPVTTLFHAAIKSNMAVLLRKI